MFDNTPQPSPTKWSSFKDHLPIIALALGVGGLAIGLHTAATAVAVLAFGHVVVAGLLFAYSYFRRSQAARQQ